MNRSRLCGINRCCRQLKFRIQIPSVKCVSFHWRIPKYDIALALWVYWKIIRRINGSFREMIYYIQFIIKLCRKIYISTISTRLIYICYLPVLKQSGFVWFSHNVWIIKNIMCKIITTVIILLICSRTFHFFDLIVIIIIIYNLIISIFIQCMRTWYLDFIARINIIILCPVKWPVSHPFIRSVCCRKGRHYIAHNEHHHRYKCCKFLFPRSYFWVHINLRYKYLSKMTYIILRLSVMSESGSLAHNQNHRNYRSHLCPVSKKRVHIWMVM